MSHPGLSPLSRNKHPYFRGRRCEHALMGQPEGVKQGEQVVFMIGFIGFEVQNFRRAKLLPCLEAFQSALLCSPASLSSKDKTITNPPVSTPYRSHRLGSSHTINQSQQRKTQTKRESSKPTSFRVR